MFTQRGYNDRAFNLTHAPVCALLVRVIKQHLSLTMFIYIWSDNKLMMPNLFYFENNYLNPKPGNELAC